jgi:peptidoglycan hydrolase CwlO-like protein
MKKQTKQAIDKLNQVIDDYINIFDSNKKEIKEIEQSLKILIKKIERII